MLQQGHKVSDLPGHRANDPEFASCRTSPKNILRNTTIKPGKRGSTCTRRESCRRTAKSPSASQRTRADSPSPYAYLVPDANYDEAGAVTVPATGLTFGYLRYTETPSNRVFVSVECLYGFKTALPDGIKRIVKP